MNISEAYEILGLQSGCQPKEITKAFRLLAKKYHPDISKEANAEEMFKQINEAHNFIKDQKKKIDIHFNKSEYHNENFIIDNEKLFNQRYKTAEFDVLFDEDDDVIEKYIYISEEQALIGVEVEEEVLVRSINPTNYKEYFEFKKVSIQVPPNSKDQDIISIKRIGNIQDDLNRGRIDFIISID